MSKILVTGGAGFIGSNMVNHFMTNGHQVTVIDNLSLGRKEFIAKWQNNPNFKFYQEDLLNFKKIRKIFIAGHYDLVVHLAANSEITNYNNPEIDLKLGTLATYNVLEAMRVAGIKKLLFSSSSVIYGEAKQKPTPEDYGPLLPISFYGANKLAAEGLISSYCHIFGFQAWIFRFANVVGKNGTHGVIIDFIKKLRKNNQALEVLGDGEQCKPYLHVDDCLNGMLFTFSKAKEPVNYFNLTTIGRTKVSEIAQILLEEMGLSNVKLNYTGGQQGWPGDVAQVDLAGEKLKKLGWQAELDSTGAVKRAVKELLKQY